VTKAADIFVGFAFRIGYATGSFKYLGMGIGSIEKSSLHV
jgi:hypothetical protein